MNMGPYICCMKNELKLKVAEHGYHYLIQFFMCFINSKLQIEQKLKGEVINQLSTWVVEAQYPTQDSLLSFVSFAKEK